MFIRYLIIIIICLGHPTSLSYSSTKNDFKNDFKNDYKKKLVSFGKKFLGKSYRTFKHKDRTYKGDCSGFVTFLYATQGKNIINYNLKTKKQHSLSHRLFISLKRNKKARFHKKRNPKLGDIIFFHNTYDQNNNGKVDDYNTHVGIVSRVMDDGTIYFIHSLNTRVGVRIDKLNLTKPNSNKLNSFIRDRRRYPHPKKHYLTAQLFAYFVTIL